MWLKAHNSLYSDITINNNLLVSFPENDVLSVHIKVIPTPESADILTSRYDNINHFTSHVNSSEPIFDSVVVTGLAADALSNTMHVAAILHIKTKGGGFLQISHGEKPVNKFYNPELLPLTYSTLFMYGEEGFKDLQ